MPIQSVAPGGPNGAQILAYEVPAQVPGQVRTLRVMLLVVGVASVVSILTSVPAVLEMRDFFDGFNTVLQTVQEEGLPDFRTCNDVEGIGFACPVPGNELPPDQDPAFCRDVEGELHCGGDWALSVGMIAILGDSTQVAVNGVQIVVAVMGAIVVYIPLRYLYLWKRAGEGHPGTLGGIRLVSYLQIVVESLKVVLIVVLFSNTKTGLFDASDYLATVPVGALLAPILLWLMLKPPVRHYFSAVEYQRVGALPSLAVQGAAWQEGGIPPKPLMAPTPSATPDWAKPATAPGVPAVRRRAAWESVCPGCKAARTTDPCPACGAP